MDIKKYLEKNILLFDGAMGTYYSQKSSDGISCEYANLEDRETILEIHKEYIEAGAKCIKTNTFGANRISMNCSLYELKRVIVSAWDIAKEAAKEKEDISIFADIGPIPEEKDTDYYNSYIEIVDIFLELGAKNFLFETFSSAKYLNEIAKYIKENSKNTFILTQFAVSPDGYTRQGEKGSSIFIDTSKSKYIDATGFNCISGPNHLLNYIKQLDISNKLVSVMPNAGYPSVINNRTFFNNSKEYYASKIKECINEGVSIVGGCCGTDPSYIKEISDYIYEEKRHRIKTKSEDKKTEKKISKENRLKHKFEKGDKIIAVEVDPPADIKTEFVSEAAKRLKKIGVDAITIPDCPIARARVDSSIMSVKIKREISIDVIPHLTCRDRNLNATKALLLGLNMENVHNVLIVTGDPIPTVRRDEVKAVFEFNSVLLANYISELNKSIFETPFLISGALNVNSKNFNTQLKRAFEKKKSGMELLLTQPILSHRAYLNLKKAKQELDIRILGGIFPIVSYKNAIFMENEVSGIKISEKIINMYKELSRDESAKLACELSVAVAKAIDNIVDGYYIITPFKRVEIVENIVKRIKEGIKLESETEREIYEYIIGT